MNLGFGCLCLKKIKTLPFFSRCQCSCLTKVFSQLPSCHVYEQQFHREKTAFFLQLSTESAKYFIPLENDTFDAFVGFALFIQLTNVTPLFSEV